MTKGLSNSYMIVAEKPLLSASVDTPEAKMIKQKAKLYRYTYVHLTTNEFGEPRYNITMSHSSTYMDNHTRQFGGEKYLYGQWVADFPRNESGNASEQEEVADKKKSKSKTKATA